MKKPLKKSMFFPLIFIALFISCKKDTNNTAKEGTANITLTVGSEQVVINGPCGWATASGVHYIGAHHASDNLKVFETSFNIENPPSSTTSYTLVDDQFDTNTTHAWMTITQMVNGSFIEWTSFDGSGTITLTVSGDKITANLNGIGLEPWNNNASPYNAAGTVSGTLEFYR